MRIALASDHAGYVEKERLKQAPGFDKDKWPNMADQAWAKEIHSYYGTIFTP